MTLLTALLIAGACICLNLLLYRSGATGMDSLNGYIMQYQLGDAEGLAIEIPDAQMTDFIHHFSQEVDDAKVLYGHNGWVITSVVTLLSAAIAYFGQRQSFKAAEAALPADGKNQSGQHRKPPLGRGHRSGVSAAKPVREPYARPSGAVL